MGDHLFPVRGVRAAFAEMHEVWKSQKADDKLDTELWDIPHSCGKKVQEKTLQFFDKYLKQVHTLESLFFLIKVIKNDTTFQLFLLSLQGNV